MINWLLACVLLGLDSKGYCNLPTFVWAPYQDGGRRRWLTDTTYIGVGVSWEGKKEITTRETLMIIRQWFPVSCSTSTRRRPIVSQPIWSAHYLGPVLYRTWYSGYCIPIEMGDLSNSKLSTIEWLLELDLGPHVRLHSAVHYLKFCWFTSRISSCYKEGVSIYLCMFYFILFECVDGRLSRLLSIT